MRGGNEAIGLSLPQILRRHLLTPFNAFNFAIGLCLAAVGAYENLLYLGVICLNLLIGIVQDVRSKRIVEKLEVLTAPSVTVLRGGAEQRIPPDALRQGETFRLARGDQICADATVLSGEIFAEESLLTRESAPVRKAAGAPLLSGSFVAAGSCTARADRVGEACYAASIVREARRSRGNRSMILRALNRIVHFTGFFILPLGIVLFLERYVAGGAALRDAVVTVSAALLGLLPKGLVLLTSVSLAAGVLRLGKRRTLVQELYGIESLARVDVLCMDKTGTLTEGAMQVQACLPLREDAVSPAQERWLAAFCRAFAEDGAVLSALRRRFSGEDLPRAESVAPFSSARGWSAAWFAGVGAFYLGAAERLLPALPPEVLRAEAEGAQVLVFAFAQAFDPEALPGDLAPLFAVCLRDAVRPEAAETLCYFRSQGVRLLILSGDSARAAQAVANQAGFSGEARSAEGLRTPEDFDAAVRTHAIFGRVMPEQKREFVAALQRQGHVVGFLGDGVNDVLAIHRADCGVAMASGCDAARRAAQLVLLDSDFSALPDVVREGRRVVNNIRLVAPLFLTKTCFSFLLSLLCALTGWAYPFTPLHLSAYSFLFEALPALALTFRPNDAPIAGDIVRDAIHWALPFALAVTAGVALICMGASGLPAMERLGSWSAFAWLCCMGALLCANVALRTRRAASALG